MMEWIHFQFFNYYIASLQGNYSEELPTQARRNNTV